MTAPNGKPKSSVFPEVYVDDRLRRYEFSLLRRWRNVSEPDPWAMDDLDPGTDRPSSAVYNPVFELNEIDEKDGGPDGDEKEEDKTISLSGDSVAEPENTQKPLSVCDKQTSPDTEAIKEEGSEDAANREKDNASTGNLSSENLSSENLSSENASPERELTYRQARRKYTMPKRKFIPTYCYEKLGDDGRPIQHDILIDWIKFLRIEPVSFCDTSTY